MADEQANLGLLYYKKYYKDILTEEYVNHIGEKAGQEVENQDENAFTKINNKITGIRIKESVANENTEKNLYTHTIPMVTTYPGLLIGSGTTHLIGENGEFKLGFQFDYTTGLPVIPGSSVKGTVRDFLSQVIELSENDEGLLTDFMKVYNDCFKGNDEKRLPKDIRAKLKEFFDSFFGETMKENTKPAVFFDAEITKSDDKEHKILSEDYITPHTAGIFENPNPIKFLKVLPSVTFEFRFRLYDDKYSTADQKQELIRKILLYQGIGAKTNVGYGQFDEAKSDDWAKQLKKEKEHKKKLEYKQNEKKMKLDQFEEDIKTLSKDELICKLLMLRGKKINKNVEKYIDDKLEIQDLQELVKTLYQVEPEKEELENLNEKISIANIPTTDLKNVIKALYANETWKEIDVMSEVDRNKKEKKNKDIKRYKEITKILDKFQL